MLQLQGHRGAVTSQAGAQGFGSPQQHPQLHQGAAEDAHPVAMGSHTGAGLPHAGQVNMLPVRFAGQRHCRECLIWP